MRLLAHRFSRDEAGAAIVEYSLIVAGISVATIAALWAAGAGLRDTFMTLTDFLAAASK